MTSEPKSNGTFNRLCVTANVCATFIVLRTEKDKRSAFIKWKPVDNAFAYNIYYGTDPGKLYTSIMIHANNEYWMKAMDSQKTYYYCIEAINENGVSERSKIIEVK